MPQIANRPMILLVLDGWGYSENTQYNAVHSANKPTWDSLWSFYPHMLIKASGSMVGLPDTQMGNSEVGHTHIGAGRLIPQDFTRISAAIENGEFEDNETLRAAFEKAATDDRAVHLMGLLSPGGVHSHEDHILAAIRLAAECQVKHIYLHAFLDGRDTAPQSAMDSIQKAQSTFQEIGRGRIATLIGRYLAMDRNQHWLRTEEAWALIADSRATYVCNDPYIALDQAYERGETDEFIKPTAIVPRGKDPARIIDGDIVVFMNYRADRARQLTRAFTEEDFNGFNRSREISLGRFVSLTQYSADFECPAAFTPNKIKNSFGELISNLGLKQLRIAETEKYAHVTFFFNGGEERPFIGEDRILVPSPHVATYDEKPEMSAFQLTDRLIESIHSDKYDVIICNYANPDMVGHTGNFDATVKAVEAVDRSLGRIVAAARSVGGELLITADHGNAEKMREVSTKKRQGQVHTAHTTNLVPLVYVGRLADMSSMGGLPDLSPTMLYLMGLDIPEEMTGTSLVQLEDEEETGIRPRQRLSRLLG